MSDTDQTPSGGDLGSPEPGADAPQKLEAPLGPPRGVHAMAFFRWMLIIGMALVAVWSVVYSFGLVSAGPASAADAQYYCPMHPQVVQDHPGECPICSMTLVLRENSGKGASSPPAKPKVVSHEGHRHEPADPYYCPMHPEETGVDADARCPICGMKLERKKSARAAGSAPQAPSAAPPAKPTTDSAPKEPQGVPGLVPVELGMDRVQSIGVRTARATAEALVPELRTVGFVTADEAKVARVHARFSGWIEKMAVATTGEKVRRGQVLAGLYNLELLPAQQEFLAAERWATGGHAGASHGSASPQVGRLAEDARARLELFGLSKQEIDAIASTGKPVRTVAVTAPIAGYVVRKTAVQGTYIQPGTELFEIADLSRVWVLADIYEYEIARVAAGQVAKVAVAAYPMESFTGTIGFIYPAVDSATRTLRVRVELDNKGLKLRPGMYGDVVIELAAAEGVVVPAEALVDTGEYQYVFLAKDAGRFEPRRVFAGARSGDKVQILEGLTAGETVVTTANFMIDSESRLRAAITGR